MPLPFQLVNVFSIAGEPFSGNPLCVFHDAPGLDEADRLAWARQFISESTFVQRRAEGDQRGEADVRIFTPGHEHMASSASRGASDVSLVVSQGSAVGRPSRLLLDIDAAGGVRVGGRVDPVGSGTCSFGGEEA